MVVRSSLVISRYNRCCRSIALTITVLGRLLSMASLLGGSVDLLAVGRVIVVEGSRWDGRVPVLLLALIVGLRVLLEEKVIGR